MENRSTSQKAALAVIFLAVVPNLLAQATGSVSARVLAYFDHISKDQHLDDYFNMTRPKPVSPASKKAAFANLPPDGEVRPSAKGRVKIDTLTSVLEFYERSGIIEIKVIGDKETLFIGIYERCALIITEKALDLLSREELQAVVAHELAHEWFWNEYRLAREAGQDDKVQEIDLRCDGIAILTLARLGLDPRELISAVRKMTRYSQDTPEAGKYLPPKQRLAFADAMVNWVKNVGPTIFASAGGSADPMPK